MAFSHWRAIRGHGRYIASIIYPQSELLKWEYLKVESDRFPTFLDSVFEMQFQQMTGYVIFPVHTQVAAVIIGFYFGGGLAK